MNPRVLAAMNELNNLNWDQYLSPPKSTKPPALRKNDTSLSLSEGSQPVESPHGSQKQDYSGFVFKDISQELNLESKHEINQDKDCGEGEQPEQTSQPEEQDHFHHRVHGDDNGNDQLERIDSGEIENDERKDDNDDELSEGSNEPVLSENNEDDDFDLDSPDSLSTKESFNDQEILAHNNAIKNKDILHESFLQENHRNLQDSLEFHPENNDHHHQPPQQNASHSVEGDTKSVTFADEDSIHEFEENGGEDGDADDPGHRFYDQPPDMDPNSIPTTDDREEVTRRYMMEAVREEAHRSAVKNSSPQRLGDDNTPQPQELLLLDHSTNEELEKQFAREKFEELLLTSPEFRAAILSYQAIATPETKSIPLKKKKSTRLPPETRPSKTALRPTTKKKNLHAKPYSESSVADSLDSNVLPVTRPSSAPSLSRKTPSPLSGAATATGNRSNLSKFPKAMKKRNDATLSSLPQHLNNGELQQNEMILMSKTANLEHIYRLAQDTLRPSPSIEFAPLPPKLSTDCPMLPFDGIMKLAELNLIGDSPLIELHPDEQKLRLKLKYFACLSDWEFSNRLDFFGLHFFRSEYFVPSSPPSTSCPSPSPSTDPPKLSLSPNLTPSSTKVQEPSPPPPVPSKKKLLLTHESIKDLLFANRTKDLRKNFPHLFQFNSFIKETYTGFVCLVFDMKLQLLGTYDHKSKDFYPGLVICPLHLQATKKKKRSIDTTLTNLFEVDLHSLPLETFAIVPVLYDDTPHGAQFPEMNFQFDLSVTESRSMTFREDSTSSDSQCVGGGIQRDGPYWLPTTELEQPSEATPIHDLFEVERDQDPMVIAAPDHVVDLDPGWTHVESYFCHRPTMITDPDDSLEGPTPIQVEKMATQSKVSLTLARLSCSLLFLGDNLCLQAILCSLCDLSSSHSQ
jgi:hypothetical protein